MHIITHSYVCNSSPINVYNSSQTYCKDTVMTIPRPLTTPQPLRYIH